MAKKKRKGGGGGRRKRSRGVTHIRSVTVPLVALAIPAFILTYGGSASVLTYIQAGNWQSALNSLGAVVQYQWPTIILLLIPILIIAAAAKKFGRRLHLSRHYSL